MSDHPFDVQAALNHLAAAASRANQRPMVPEAKIHDEIVTISLPPAADAAQLVAAFDRLGLPLADFEVGKVHYRQAGGTDQVKIDFKPRAWRVQPARTPGPTFDRAPVHYGDSEPRLVVFCGDQQRPYDDTLFHEAFLRFLDEAGPDEVVNLGDLGNFTSIGNKHRPNPKRTPDPMRDTQQCVDGCYDWWLDVSQAGSRTLRRKVWIPGNHEEHLVKAMIEAEEGKLFDLRRAGDPDGYGVNTLRHLCRLDELGVEWISDPLGDWPRAKYRVGEYVYARHGSIVRPEAGASARAAIQNIEYTLFLGHTHRQGVAPRTVWDRNGGYRTIYGVEIGGMHLLNGQGYEDQPDQQNGFATIHLYPDGTYTPPMLASWIDGALRWGTMTITKTAHGFHVAA